MCKSYPKAALNVEQDRAPSPVLMSFLEDECNVFPNRPSWGSLSCVPMAPTRSLLDRVPCAATGFLGGGLLRSSELQALSEARSGKTVHSD